jgi:hypothetical protein
VDEGLDYAVAGTRLRLRLERPLRANLPTGHMWSGQLLVWEGNEHTELSLGGPDAPPTIWHGYAFTLVFVDPTSVLVTRSVAAGR